MLTKLHRRFDQLPEPTRFISFIAMLFVILATGSLLNIWFFPFGDLVLASGVGLMMISRIWYLRR